MKFYYRPLLEDTKTRVIKAIEPTQKELIETLSTNPNNNSNQ